MQCTGCAAPSLSLRCTIQVCWHEGPHLYSALALKMAISGEAWQGRRSPPQSFIMHKLHAEIERLYSSGSLPVEVAGQARQVFDEFRNALTCGEIRAAEKHAAQWRVNPWVKQGILLGFRLGELEEIPSGAFTFVDKDTFPARRFGIDERIRLVPGGSSVRQG